MMEDTDLHVAVRFGDIKEVRSALRDCHDPNQIGLYEWSPLHEAAHNGDLATVKLLLDYKANPNKPDLLRGNTAVHYAASQQHYECLEILLEHGGHYGVQNSDGNTCLDVAQGSCKQLLQKFSEKENGNKDMLDSDKDTILQHVLEDTAPEEAFSILPDAPSGHEADTASQGTCLSYDFDKISISSDGSSLSPEKAWGEGVLSFDKELALGHAYTRLVFAVLGHTVMSFEYNKKASTFKIRIWQLKNLILPPAETSMIQAIYIRSYLLPDKSKKSKRSTESISVSKLTKLQPSKEFQPVTIMFTKPLEYQKITESIIDEKIVYLEVRIQQKYTMRSFVIATWNMPLKTAVKRLVKDQYALTPKISTSIPDNMKVYSGHNLRVSFNNRAFVSSFPNSRMPSSSNLRHYPEERAASDSDLMTVTTENVTRPFIQVMVPSDDDDLDPFKVAESRSNVTTASLHSAVGAGTSDSSTVDLSVSSFPGAMSDLGCSEGHNTIMSSDLQQVLRSVLHKTDVIIDIPKETLSHTQVNRNYAKKDTDTSGNIHNKDCDNLAPMPSIKFSSIDLPKVHSYKQTNSGIPLTDMTAFQSNSHRKNQESSLNFTKQRKLYTQTTCTKPSQKDINDKKQMKSANEGTELQDLCLVDFSDSASVHIGNNNDIETIDI